MMTPTQINFVMKWGVIVMLIGLALMVLGVLHQPTAPTYQAPTPTVSCGVNNLGWSECSSR